jgi:hypothetical protein
MEKEKEDVMKGSWLIREFVLASYAINCML